MPVYQYGKSKLKRGVPEKISLAITKQPETIGLIDGQIPGSIEEYRVYKSIKKLGLRYEYQFPISGGRDRRGGVVLDFLVWNPFPIPLPIHGVYWHRGDETFEDALIANYFDVSIDYIHEHIIWDYEIPTQEDADRIVRQRAR